MAKIARLSTYEANKIAAGEVVERPAHIVKELIENALDAHATQITLYLEHGGKTLIRIVDNGVGMDAQDAQLCFEKHATSKITTIDDLQSVETFGFRGEALASIAAVARVTLKTKEAHAIVGTQVVIQHAIEQKISEVSMNTGTDIAVADLFYAIPARKKFLKADSSEWRHVQQLIQAFCLSYRAIHFVVYLDGKQVINCPPADSLILRWKQLWPEQKDNMMLALSSSGKGSVFVEGLVSHYQESAYDRSGIFFFVNNRWVKNVHLHRALTRGYDNILPSGKYCRAVIHITCPAVEVDINIHPRKEEVKFMHPRIIEQMIATGVKQVLEQKRFVASQSLSLIRPSSLFAGAVTENSDFFPRVVRTSEVKTYHQEPAIIISHKQQELASYSNTISHDAFVASKDQIAQKEYSVVEQSPGPVVEQQAYTLIGQYNKTYLLCESIDGLVLIDQHAAHERILYEQFASRFKEIPVVHLIAPLVITLREQDIELLKPYHELLAENGIVLEQCGAYELLIRATPVSMQGQAFDAIIKQMIGWIIEYQDVDADELTRLLHDKIRAMMACKAAVKAGDVLTTDQMNHLLTNLEQTTNKNSCPHGRPTGWLIPLYEIEKKFKRRK